MSTLEAAALLADLAKGSVDCRMRFGFSGVSVVRDSLRLGEREFMEDRFAGGQKLWGLRQSARPTPSWVAWINAGGEGYKQWNARVDIERTVEMRIRNRLIWDLLLVKHKLSSVFGLKIKDCRAIEENNKKLTRMSMIHLKLYVFLYRVVPVAHNVLTLPCDQCCLCQYGL